jgi:hypothetical protein
VLKQLRNKCVNHSSSEERKSTQTRLIWFGERKDKTILYLYGDENTDNVYDETGPGKCQIEYINCDKIKIMFPFGHEMTLERVK